MKTVSILVLTSTVALAGCLGNGSNGAAAGAAAVTGQTATRINLPVTGSGRVISRSLPGNVTQNGDGSFSVQPTSATPIGAGATPTGGATFDYAADRDPAGSQQQAGTGQTVNALVDVNNFANLGGANYTAVNDATSRIYFENGNFGGPQVFNDPTLQVSAVDIYNPQGSAQIVLSDVTTFRANGFNNAGAQNVSFGVGFAGNNTAPAQIPAAGTATYRSFIEGGVSGYNDGGTFRQASPSTNPRGQAVEMVANFGTGRMRMDLNGLDYSGAGTAGGATDTRNATVDGVIFDVPITGNSFDGVDGVGGAIVQLVDAADAPINGAGNQEGEVIGGFFGTNAAEAAAALVITGNMDIDNGVATANRDYIISWSIGGTQ